MIVNRRRRRCCGACAVVSRGKAPSNTENDVDERYTVNKSRYEKTIMATTLTPSRTPRLHAFLVALFLVLGLLRTGQASTHFVNRFKLTRDAYKDIVEWCVENDTVDVTRYVPSHLTRSRSRGGDSGDSFNQTGEELVKSHGLESLQRCG